MNTITYTGTPTLAERAHQRTMHETGAHDTYSPTCPICLDMWAADVFRSLYEVSSDDAEPCASGDEGSAEVPPDRASTVDTNAGPAEPAEPVFNAKPENGLPAWVEEEIAKQVPHVPHVPQTDSDRADFDAETVQQLARGTTVYEAIIEGLRHALGREPS